MKRRTEPAILITCTFTPEQAAFVKGLGRLGLSKLVADIMEGRLVDPTASGSHRQSTSSAWWRFWR